MLRSKKIIQWATTLSLYGPNYSTFVGLLSFALINESNRIRRRISSCELNALAHVCNTMGIIPPALSQIKSDHYIYTLLYQQGENGRDVYTCVHVISLLLYLLYVFQFYNREIMAVVI